MAEDPDTPEKSALNRPHGDDGNEGSRPKLPVRVLLVDDFEPFRKVICSMLQNRPEVQVICEVADGCEAVQKAEELQPDLILLDIGLPRQDGMEAARRIRTLAPESKILFISQESSADVVQEALSLGAGYMLKTRTGSELLTAVEAVLQGKQFVSAGLAGCLLANVSDDQAPDQFHSQGMQINRQHEVQFYSDDASFLEGLTSIVEIALKAGSAVIVVATEPHRKSLLQGLQAHAVDVVAAIEQGRYISLDATETLCTFMVIDLPDRARFFRVRGDLIMATARAAKGEHPNPASGSAFAPILWSQGKTDAAVQLERLWDEIARTYNVDILCGYVVTGLQREQEGHAYERICAEHSAVRSQKQPYELP